MNGGKQLRLHFAPLAGVVFAFVCGCHNLPTESGTATVSAKLAARTGVSLSETVTPNEPLLPQGLSADKPLTEDQAVLLALWNNPGLQEALVDLKLTRADLIQAGLLPNPEVVYFFQVTDKPFKYAVDFPLEALWLRPVRLKAAAAENDRACERLTQVALDLIRDTRQAVADCALARERHRIAIESVKLRGNVAQLAEKRVQAGDASVAEITTARIDALIAKQEADRIAFEVPLAEERLKNLMGLARFAEPVPVTAAAEAYTTFDIEALVNEAMASRPDLLAATIAVQAANERLRLARISWVRFLGLLDATSGRVTGHEFGPAFRVTLPLFNWNQGIIARAEAEQEQLDKRCCTLRNQIITDVRLAATRFQQATTELNTLRTQVRPQVEAGIVRSEKALQAGNASYLLVLESTRQLLDTHFREAQLKAERQRAWADLERSVGRHLANTTSGGVTP